jgi:TatD DNase family protein
MLIDSHAHLNLIAFENDLDQIIMRANQSGVEIIVNVGLDIASSQVGVDVTRRYDYVFTTVGFHPNSSSKMMKPDIDRLAGLATDRKVVAVGETGLDYYRHYATPEDQLIALRRQLDLATELRLPVVIHCRQAHGKMLEVLSAWAKSIPYHQNLGVIHCFSGDIELARRYVDLGFLISLAGSLTYPNAGDLRMVARKLPLERLLIETDSPFLTPQKWRGKRNEPSFVSQVVDKIAQLRDIPMTEVAQVTSNNAISLFRLPAIKRSK